MSRDGRVKKRLELRDNIPIAMLAFYYYVPIELDGYMNPVSVALPVVLLS